MELLKTNESVQKEYDSDGTVKNEVVNNISYQIRDGDKAVGTANIYTGGYSLNVNGGSKTIDELKVELEILFN